MWLPRAKTVNATSSSSKFSFPSFKDIQQLCAKDDDFKPPHSQKQSPSIFHRVRVAKWAARSWPTRYSPELNADGETNSAQSEPPLSYLPGSEKRVVVYYTSLGVVRSTFEECRAVQLILRGFRLAVDERDVSMDSKFMEELQGILGKHIKGGKVTLPRVFISGRYIGGAEEIKQLHEIGELKKFVEGLPAAEPGVCEVCGGYRFILCDECSGSHKCYSEKGGFRTCTGCNENGLIRCPTCL